MRKFWTPFFYAPEAAAGAGAATETVVDDKGAAATADKAAADKAAADKATADAATADKAAADKAAADAAAATEAAKANETPEQKTARETKEKADADAAAKAKVPEKYELKVAKDAATFVDADDLKTIEKVARDKGLTNDQAQAMVDARAAALLEQSVAFRAVTEADPELGGDHLPETTRLVKVAMDKIYPAGTKDGDAFRQMLQKTGYGNNRLILKHFRELGRQMDEDAPGNTGATGKSGGKDAASVLYDNPTSKTT